MRSHGGIRRDRRLHARTLTIRSIAAAKIRYIGARDERSAGLMADSYARICGGPGVALAAQAGPGVANFATAVAEAHLAYSPLVVIAGAVQRSDRGKDTFQEIDQVSIFKLGYRSCRNWSRSPKSCRAPSVEAINLSMTGRRGPVVLHVPRDLFSASLDDPDIRGFKPPRPLQPSVRLDAAGRADDWRGHARPVIVAGGGLMWSNAAADLRKLAEQNECAGCGVHGPCGPHAARASPLRRPVRAARKPRGCPTDQRSGSSCWRSAPGSDSIRPF